MLTHLMRRAGALLVLAVTLSVLAAPADANVRTMGSNLVGSDRIFITDTAFPMFGTLNAKTTVPVTTVSRNEPGTLSFVRWSWQSSVIQSLQTNWTPGATTITQRTDQLTFDPAKSSVSGYNENRVTSNFSTPERRFTTSRLCINVRGTGATGYCGGPTQRGRCGGGSWYVATAYSVFFIDCRDLAAILAGHPPASLRIKFQTDGTGGYGLLSRDPQGTQPLSGHYPANTWITVANPGGVFWGLSVEGNGQDGGFEVG